MSIRGLEGHAPKSALREQTFTVRGGFFAGVHTAATSRALIAYLTRRFSYNHPRGSRCAPDPVVPALPRRGAVQGAADAALPRLRARAGGGVRRARPDRHRRWRAAAVDDDRAAPDGERAGRADLRPILA